MTTNKITKEDVEDFLHTGGFAMYQHIAIKSAIYPGRGTFFGLSYCAHKLAGEAGEFNDHLGKAMRDDGIMDATVEYMFSADGVSRTVYRVIVHGLSPERRNLLINELGDCLWYLSALAKELNISLGEIALMNLRKLQSRTERGVLQGEGDKR